jgi:hypothetical protein
LNQVYDVTPYVEEHPGGDAILNNAGGDSTEGFFGFVTYIASYTSYHSVIGSALQCLSWNCFFRNYKLALRGDIDFNYSSS